MTLSYPPYVTREVIAERLPLIFPEGTENRSYCIRDVASATVFSALYVGAVEGTGRYFAPAHVYKMTEEQSAESEGADREAYYSAVLAKKPVQGSRWYADNTREAIRDETLRDGFVSVGAVVRRTDLPTTSDRPKYVLTKDFAALFEPILQGKPLETAIATFQTTNLSKSAQTRLAIIRAGAAASASGVLIAFPSGETRLLAPGPSSVISKAVVEQFAPAFLEHPAVLWLSESGNKVAFRDDQIAKQIGLDIQPDKDLPDLILADLGPDDPLIIFVEVVATDGAVTPRRRAAFYELTDAAGFKRRQIVALTAFQDRQSAGFKKTVTQLSWGTFAWFVSEPSHIITLHESLTDKKLSDVVGKLD